MIDLQLVVGVLTIIGSMYAMLKFMLKDITKDMSLHEKALEEFKQELRHVNNRMDGLYRILIDRTYGKNVPKDLDPRIDP